MSPARKILRILAPDHRELYTAGRGIALAAAVGLVAGIGAILFQILCQGVMHYGLAMWTGYNQHGPSGEHHIFHDVSTNFIPWMLLIVPTVGGLISGWIIFRYAPEAEGHGTDSAINAYHHKSGKIRPQVPIVKMITAAITLGTGGSGGREGPIAQIGAGFGSYLATRLKLSADERRILMAAGLGAGISAIFQAPLAGAIFAVEVLYSDPDFEAEALIPAFISTTIAYCTFNVIMTLAFGAESYQSLFTVAEMKFRDPLLLAPLTALVIVMIFAAWFYVKMFYSTQRAFHKLNIRPWLKPSIGAFATGAFALAAYFMLANVSTPQAQNDSLSILSFGYGYLQSILNDPNGLNLSIGILLLVGIGKIITTSLTIGSGGSGGVFGPSMVIGGCLGAVVGLLFKEWMPQTVTRVDYFVILGMAGFFAAAAKTPVSTLIMVSELTGSYELLLPAMWVCALAYLFSRGWSIYAEQVPKRIDSPAHRGDFIVDVLKDLTVNDAIKENTHAFTTIPLDMPLSQVVKVFAGTKQTCFPVVDNNDQYYGLFSLHDVRQFLYDSDIGDLAVALDLATADTPPLAIDLDLGSAMTRFAVGGFDELPVIDPDQPKTILGMLHRQDVIAAYNEQLLHIKTTEPHLA